MKHKEIHIESILFHRGFLGLLSCTSNWMKQQEDLTFIMFPRSWVPYRKLSYPAEWAEPQPAGPAGTWPRQAHGPCGCRGELSAAGEWPAGPGLRLQSSGPGRPARSLQAREQTGRVRPREPLDPESCLLGSRYHLPSSPCPFQDLEGVKCCPWPRHMFNF